MLGHFTSLHYLRWRMPPFMRQCWGLPHRLAQCTRPQGWGKLDHRQLVKFWRSCAPGKGLRRGIFGFALLQPSRTLCVYGGLRRARSVCVSQSDFYFYRRPRDSISTDYGALCDDAITINNMFWVFPDYFFIFSRAGWKKRTWICIGNHLTM